MSLAVIGAGAWGTALALRLAERDETVALWAYEADLAAAMRQEHENRLYLPGVPLPATVHPTADLAVALRSPLDLVLMAVPSHALRTVLGRVAPLLDASVPVVLATKGLEQGTLMRVSEVAASVLGPAAPARLATLSGPTFAREIAQGEPAAVVIASQHAATAERLQARLSSSTLRLYASSDVVGVELGAALKNVIAIASGICQGLGLGSNTRAALIARGLAEMSRLATAAGGQAETLAGLAGLGDLVLTCTGELSRNRALGIGLGQGRSRAEIEASTPTVAEGVWTTPAALELARRLNVELPITQQMDRVLFESLPPRQALTELMQRPLTRER
jgi:glycerol-3-phosphate dehydrogenase (NAD(P)+)